LSLGALHQFSDKWLEIDEQKISGMRGKQLSFMTDKQKPHLTNQERLMLSRVDL